MRRSYLVFAVLLGLIGSMLGAGQASAQVSVGHSGWFWGNPQPQGNTIRGMAFAGSRGYAAGEFGTLLATDDAGASWTGISTGITRNLVRVRAIDANTVVIGGGCALRRSDDGGQTFQRLPWTASDTDCPSELASFFFPSPGVGYLLTLDGAVFQTADGGQTFARKTSVPGVGGNISATDIFFLSDDTGVATTSQGKIYRTTDGGNSWVEVASSGSALNGLTFAGAGTGYAVGGHTTILKTTDGGMTWNPMPAAGVPDVELKSISCADALTCLITDASGDRVLRTIDGGLNYTSVVPADEPIFAAAFASPTRAVAAGDFGVTVVSDDAGDTWTRVGSRIVARGFTDFNTLTGFRRVNATNAQIAVAVGSEGQLARTVDGGVNWFEVGVPTGEALNDASFPTQDVGYAIDAAAGAFKTQNGGASWSILNPGTPVAPNSVLALDADHVLLVGPKGVRLSTNGGGSFDPVDDKDVKKASLQQADQVGSAVFAFGAKSLVYSPDGGQSWSRKRLPARKSRLADVDFVSSQVGFALTTDGRVWRTTNGGRKWKDLPGVGTDLASGISFSSENTGYLAVGGFAALQTESGNIDGGYGFHTADGGKSWQPQLISQNSLDIVDAGPTAFGVARNGRFYATDTAGALGAPTTLTISKKAGKGASEAARKKGKKPVKITGALSPAEGGEQVVVSVRQGTHWNSQVATVASNGTFSATFTAKRTVYFVAQWQGDDDRAGAGTAPLKVKVKKKHKKKK